MRTVVVVVGLGVVVVVVVVVVCMSIAPAIGFRNGLGRAKHRRVSARRGSVELKLQAVSSSSPMRAPLHRPADILIILTLRNT